MTMYYLYLGLINVLTFVLMWMDRRRAYSGRWRIPEWILLGSNILGGCFAGYASMHLLHHKTRKAKFTITIPILMVVYVCLSIYLAEAKVL
ncbi:MAG: DUF1294 domain-containing protein [Oscillospiraceae bacterium]|nr:DUF1294 domain-containing protein [Oscillospiraceae bacterium]